MNNQIPGGSVRDKRVQPCQIGDIVYIIGKYAPCGVAVIVQAKISHIKHRRFVAYTVDDCGEWCFSKKHIGKSVFFSKEDAEKVYREVFEK